MKNSIQHLLLSLAILLLAAFAVQAQVSPNCATASDDDFITGQVFLNNGSVSNAISPQRTSKFTSGQYTVGQHFGGNFRGAFGLWSRFLKIPNTPNVLASEGDLEDRVQVDWFADPLSPAASGGFKIYRDGSLLATVDGSTFSYIDFNVVAGKFYTYEVSGVNSFGEGAKGIAIGFLNPNGVVTGQVKTLTGNPVPGAVITLAPTLGAALEFGGDDMAFAEHSPVYPTDEFTVSAWVKVGDGNDGSAIIDGGSTIGKNWWLHTMPGGQKGVRFAIGNGAGPTTFLDDPFPAATASDWHQVAATYNGSSLLLYVDGELKGTAVGQISADSISLFFGRKADGTKFYNGKLDEVRFYNRQLSQTEIQMFMNRTVSATTPGLVAYWKFDEGTGSKAFDQSGNDQKIYFCGSTWTTDKPTVVNAGVTDEAGFYEIAGVNYGAGQTFTAVASKNSYYNQSLEFNAANETYADLNDFDLPDSATMTLFVKGFDFSANDQTILSKATAAGANLLRIAVRNGNVEMTIGSGTAFSFGALGMGFHHLAFTLRQSGTSLVVNYFKNGVAAGSNTFSGSTANLTGLPWKLGAMANGTSAHDKYFTGLIDEVAFFNTLLQLADIQEFVNIGTKTAHPALFHYFNLNEGSGTALNDMGNALGTDGTTHGATFSSVAAIGQTLAHEFTPSSRLATLNPSNTSVDQVDFTDQSTIPVSGFVRFEGTNCFQDSVEILVNGKSHTPRIFTNADGEFVGDFEPGADVTLTPVFGDHAFNPAFWELENLSTPVSGLLFRNQTKRKVFGQLAGGHCRKSVIPANAIVKVKVETLNGCFSKTLQLTSENGKFVFENIPPDDVTVSVVQHSNPVIFNFFSTQGGVTLDLKEKNDTTDFIYLAQPQLELSQLDTNNCGDPMLVSLEDEEITIKVFEDYDGGRCYLDSALLTIDNQISDLGQFDTLMTKGSLTYRFTPMLPNIVAPHLKSLQITAEAHDELTFETLSAVVLGRKPRATTFTSTAPEFPTLILRDPPGDGSYSFLEQGTSTCQNWSFSATDVFDHEEHVVVSLGPDLSLTYGIVSFTVDQTIDLGFQHTGSTTSFASNSFEQCTNITRTVSTGTNDLIVGSAMGGDVYMGGAMNFLYGITDELFYDTANCAVVKDVGLYMFPEGFATTFIYTEYEILNDVIPELVALGDTVSAALWQSFVDSNTVFKNRAPFEKNISFDAGVVFEESSEISATKTTTYQWTQQFSNGFSAEFGATFAGVGLSAGLTMSWSYETTADTTTSTSIFRKTGYVLADDDFGDNFTVNIKNDKHFLTPVFDLVSGQTQCPHEPNSQPRQGVSMTTDKFVAVNVPMNDPAVFLLTLGNASQSENSQTYTLGVLQETNPLGAVVRFNGDISPLEIFLLPGQSVQVVMTIERGPIAFDYEDIVVYFTSQCEFDASGILNSEISPEFYQQFEYDVHFLEPCSPVEVGFPQQGWVHTPADGNSLTITINDYIKSDPDLELIRAQYRRTQGDGNWINITEVPKAALGPVFTNVTWNTTGLQDGLYEIRAVTQCFSGALNPGISHIIPGKIERTPPELFGTPEPADGVYDIGDEISIRFNEPIRCDLLIEADVFNNNNIGLYNTRTGDLVNFGLSCSGDKIILVPAVPQVSIENEILRVEVDSIKDLAGNAFDHTSWEFFVNLNPLRWQVPDLTETKFEDEAKTVHRAIANVGGSAQAYQLKGIPNWAKVFPTQGVLSPGQVQFITFEFDDDLVVGQFLDTIVMDAALGDEPLPVNFRNLCRPPAWAEQFNPADFDFSMNMAVELDIEGDLSTDEEDLVAAFINGQVRGLAYVERVLSGPLDTAVAFLTVYSDNFSGETVTFRVWDASECLLYGAVVESFPFDGDEVIGAPNAPVTLHTDNKILQRIPLKNGWNWISHNLVFPDPAINPALSGLKHPQGDLVKNQTAFANYAGAPVNSWIGSLTDLGNLSMYQFRADQPDTLTLLGAPVSLSTNIPVVPGWNWVGYLPQSPMTVDEALSSLTALNGDVVKNQTAFAQYVAGLGWIGNLRFMQAPEGYLLKVANAGTLNYPDSFTGGGPAEQRNAGAPYAGTGGGDRLPWSVDPSQFEHSMTLVGMLSEGAANTTREGMTLGAFAGNEARGIAPTMYVEALDTWLFFLTVYANEAGEPVTFKLYDAGSDAISDLQEGLFFANGDQEGTVLEPMPFTLPPNATGEMFAAQSRLLVQPNPFSHGTVIRYEAPLAGEVALTVTDALGRQVERLDWHAVPGWNTLEWTAEGLPGGVYILRMGAVCKKVVLER